MSEMDFQTALSNLETSTDSTIVLESLTVIKKGVSWPKDFENITKISTRAALNSIVSKTQFPEKVVVNSSLSVLGNCCMDKSVAKDLVETHRIYFILSTLLERWKDDSIRGRIFRITANICQHERNMGDVIVATKEEIVKELVAYVTVAAESSSSNSKKKISDATLQMALRALRYFVNNSTIVKLVTCMNVLKIVGRLLRKYVHLQPRKQSTEVVLRTIIMLLEEYCTFRYYPSMTDFTFMLRGNSKLLSKIIELEPQRVVKIVMNLTLMCKLKSELPLPEIFETFMDILEKTKDTSGYTKQYVEYLQCLGSLLDCPSNRNSFGAGPYLPKLIKILEDFDTPSNYILECCIVIVRALTKFMYDSSVIFVQLKCNIMEVVMGKLRWLVGDSEELLTEHDVVNIIPTRKMYQDNAESSEMELEHLRRLVLDGKRCLSPSITSDEECDDSRQDLFKTTDDLAWFRSNFPSGVEKLGITSIRTSSHYFFGTFYPETSSNYERRSLILRQRLISSSTELLTIYSGYSPGASYLRSEKSLLTLLKCSLYYTTDWDTFRELLAVNLIVTILTSNKFLVALMQTSFIQKVYALMECQHNETSCTVCNHLKRIGDRMLSAIRGIAESGGGKGDIAHILLTSECDNIKQKIALNIPYVIHSRVILNKLLINCKGLNVLMTMLQENISNNEIRNQIIKGLCAMASKNLFITNPKSVVMWPNKVVAPIVRNKTITFKLDDESELKADKELLENKSDFFNRLFNGSFKESTEDVIKLSNVKHSDLKILFDLLSTNCSIIKTLKVDLNTMLDVIGLADRYLLLDLCATLMEYVTDYLMTTKSLPVIYRWAVGSGTNLLRVECIAYALVGDMTNSKRFEMVETIFMYGCSTELVEDVTSMLTRYMAC